MYALLLALSVATDTHEACVFQVPSCMAVAN